MNDGLLVGARLARERLRGVALPLVLLLSATLVYVLALFNGRGDPSLAADHTLEGPLFGLIIPVLAFLLVERVCAGKRLDHSVAAVARYGTCRRAAVTGLLLAPALALALWSVLLTWLALFGTYAVHARAFWHDVLASTGVALFAGAVYVLWFGVGSLIGKRGGGRKWALIFDFVFGAGSSLLAAPWPRGHIRNLLGGSPVLDLTQHGAWLALLLIGALSLLSSRARVGN